MEIALIKSMSGYMPADQPTEDWDKKNKLGTVIHSDFKRSRNPKFHRKGFALLNLGFEYWEPGEINSKYGTPEKNFDQFRSDITILAGFYDVVIRLDGSTRVVPKSISFASMEEPDFEKWYNAVLNVILKKINVLNTKSAEEVNRLVDQVLGFA